MLRPEDDMPSMLFSSCRCSWAAAVSIRSRMASFRTTVEAVEEASSRSAASRSCQPHLHRSQPQFELIRQNRDFIRIYLDESA